MKIRFANRLAVLLCAAIILGNVAFAPDVLAGAGEQGQEMMRRKKGCPCRAATVRAVLAAEILKQAALRGKVQQETD